MSRRDPQLIERSLYALGLLEALSVVGLEFIFKGGSSMLLLLDHPMRLSTDIDIVVAPYTTGIQLRTGKDMEVMKQFYDICTLLEKMSSFENTLNTYKRIAESEINYRGLDISYKESLLDTMKVGK